MERGEIDVIDAFATALDSGDTSELRGCLDGRSLVHMPGGSGLGGDYQGTDAIVGLVDRLREESGQTLRFTSRCVSAGPGHAVHLRGAVSGQRLDRALRTPASLELRVVRGTIREVRLVCDDQRAWDAFWR